MVWVRLLLVAMQMGIIKRVAQEGMMGGRPPMGGGWGMVPALPPHRAASSLHPSCGGCFTSSRVLTTIRDVVLLTPSAKGRTCAKLPVYLSVFAVCPGGGGYGPPPGMYGGGGYGGGGTLFREIAPVFY